jgi:hypothetical protein
MKTLDECRTALDRLSENMGEAGPDAHSATLPDRSLSCRVTDHDITFTGRLRDGGIHDIETVPGAPPHRAQIRLTLTSDDLVALVDGELHFARAWGSGRVKLEASLRDLLRLRALL